MDGIDIRHSFELDDDFLFDDEVGPMPADKNISVSNFDGVVIVVTDAVSVKLERKRSLIRMLRKAWAKSTMYGDRATKNRVGEERVRWERPY